MTPSSPWLLARVVETRQETPHGRVLRLRVDGWPGNIAGQHVDVRLTAEDGYQAVRSYSLASSGESDVLELAVDELPDGEVSPYLVEDVRPDDELEVRGPIGAYFVWTPDHPGPVQLIAGGSGIVPLVAMARVHADAASRVPMRMLYSVRSPDDAFYAEELTRLAGGEGFTVDWAYTRSAPVGVARPAGRVDATMIAASTIPANESPSVFVCGPTGFVEAVADLLVAAGHSPDRIRTERFGGA
ncbi:Ferredoxin--NAD(P)(+) reductase (naphthalene dioxygenase ferredoxin-specific) [Microbacterium oxydans]|uniref:ferredoxin reductase n=1 Tax=Microbacterium oxydans TaxID=82380 RepID=UPI001DBD9988|nr:ferredoxin reductase [Microbacterium oxydans]CAH0242622.1 Ferredoxin--NAD(P)(+) reductase (naphthalene dioxygenase ferredoxin-specific) [Microbacterium oxydans]